MLQSSHLEYILLKILAAAGDISDIVMTVGHPFQMEVDGILQPVYFEPRIDKLTAFQIESIAICLLKSNRRLMKVLLTTGSCDISYSIPGRDRFRVNIFSQQGKYSIVMRRLRNEIRTLEELNLPPSFWKMAQEKNGLIVVAGSTSSGKSTTQAAILDEINNTQAVHVVTLEDPTEVIHPVKKATFNQRELGVDFQNFASGLRAAMRQAPKVILIGEVRDRETVEIALSAAETGHLVMATIHGTDTANAISRIVQFFDQEEERQVRARVAGVLRWVVSQRLLPMIGGGRVAALEIMGSTLLTKDIVVNGESEIKNFYSAIGSMEGLGFQTFDQHILEFYRQGLITDDTAMIFSSKKSIVSRGLDSVKAEHGDVGADDDKLMLESSDEAEGEGES